VPVVNPMTMCQPVPAHASARKSFKYELIYPERSPSPWLTTGPNWQLLELAGPIEPGLNESESDRRTIPRITPRIPIRLKK
jgi:hypothetical protein